MSNEKKIYPTFHFYPKALQEESIRVQKKYKHADRVSENLTVIKLPKLLEQIRALAEIDQVIIDFAQKLKRVDINILATEYPYEKEDKPTVRKIILILMEKYSRVVGRRFWLHFQLAPFDEQIIKVLNHSFDTEERKFLALKQPIREKYMIIFSSPKVLEQLAYYIGSEQRPLKESFSDWKIDKNSRLAKELWVRILYTFLRKQWFIETHGVQVIEQKLENMQLSDYTLIIDTYLKTLDFNDYNTELLKQAVQRLLDPRETVHRWKEMSDESIEKVKKWLFRTELIEFLDYERFTYWEKYLRKIVDLKVVQDPPVAAMYFGDFVVLEFAHIGNAAYFYRTEGFSKFLAPKLTAYVSESTLKDREADFYIHKINHAGSWHSRFDEFMSRYLQGNYWYRR